MKVLGHLLWRELRDQRFVLLAAPLLGLLPGLMVKLVGLNAMAEDSRRWVARLLVYGVLLAAVTVVGARWLVAGFGDGRRAFELARPLGPGQLWASKLVASVALVFGVTALVGLPSGAAIWQKAPWVDAEILSWLGDSPLAGKLGDFLVRGGSQPAGPGWLAALAFAVLLVMVAVQSLAFLLAARSWRSLADLAAWVVAGTLFAFAYLRLVQFGGLGLVASWLVPAGLAILTLGALASRRSFGAGVLLQEAHRRYALVMNLGLVALALVVIAEIGWR